MVYHGCEQVNVLGSDGLDVLHVGGHHVSSSIGDLSFCMYIHVLISFDFLSPRMILTAPPISTDVEYLFYSAGLISVILPKIAICPNWFFLYTFL